MSRETRAGGMVLIGAAVAVLVGACDPGPGERPQRGGSATVIELADMERPMPLVSESSLDQQLQAILFRPLLQAWWEDGELRWLTHEENPMALASGWELVGVDSSAIRYHMVRDARWSDGEPITAHDVVWFIETRGNPAAASPRFDFNDRIASIEAEDDHTVLIRFTHRYPEMLFHTAGPVAPRHPFEGIEPERLRNNPTMNDPAGGRLPTSGPFLIARWDRGQRFVLEPNPHFEPAPRLDRVVFRVIPEETTRMVELQTRRADMMNPVPFDKIDLLRRDAPHVRFESREGRNYEYVGYNPARFPFFDDPEVRRALGMAIDREQLVSALQMEEFARPAGGPYPPIFRELYDPEEQAVLPFDPDGARRILQEQGFRMGDDGVLRKDARPFRFTLTTNAGNQRRADVAQILQQYWRRIGVEVQIQTLESNTFIDRMLRRDLQAVLVSWGVALSPDLTAVWAPGVAFNHVGYENERVTELFERALAQPTRDRAAPYWREAASLIVEDQPYSFLYFMDDVVGVDERLQGTVINTLSTYQNMWEWWVTDAED